MSHRLPQGHRPPTTPVSVAMAVVAFIVSCAVEIAGRVWFDFEALGLVAWPLLYFALTTYCTNRPRG